MGGEHDINSLIELFIYAHKRVKTAWYCGLDMIPKDKIGILDYLDFVKIGRFDLDLGPLNSSTTNQKFYEIKRGKLYDCTNIFWK
jgi:anaerobic ribonucleoside-triphosphate reductase activating protein